MHVRYNLLQSQLIRLNRQGPDSCSSTTQTGFVDVLTAVTSSWSQNHQTPLSVSSRDSSLIQSRNAYHAVSRTLEGTYSLDAIVNAVGAAPSRCTNRADDVNNKQSVTVHRRRLSLRGRPHSNVSVSSHASPTAAVFAAACPPAWQLQQQCLIPACKGLQLLPGKVTCCCLLVADAQLQQQQRQELLQLLQQAGAVWLNSSSSSSDGEVLEVLAAAAAASCMVNDSSTSQQQRGVLHCGPVVCSSNLYSAVASALGTSSAATNCSSPSCMFLTATTSGQVWVCDAWFALLGSSCSSSSRARENGPAGSDTARQQHQQQQRQEMRQQVPLQSARRTGLRLLLDLQQPVASLLPMSTPAGQLSSSSSSSSSSEVGEGADAILLVGSLGRVGLLRLQSATVSEANLGAATNPAAAVAAAAGDQDGQGGRFIQQLSMLQQQLPFTVQAAAVASCPLPPHPQQQHQQLQGQQQQQQPSGMALLLLSGSGSVYVADLAEADTAVVGTAAAGSKSLQLQPRKLELPGQIDQLWVVHPQQQQQQGTHSTAGGFPADNTQKATNSSSSSVVILQLHDSAQLLQLMLDHNNITQSPQLRQQQLSGQADTMSPVDRCNLSVSSSDAAAAAAAARSKLQGLMSGLEILGTARKSLEQGVMQQDVYLTSVRKDLSLLQSMVLRSTKPAVSAVTGAQLGRPAVPTGATAVKRTQAAAQQQQQQPQQQPKFTCELHGLWPAPAAAAAGGTSYSSSMHMAVTVQLHAHSSGSSSGIQQLGFGPGWQLLVSFTPESATNPTWQTTVPLSCQTQSCPGPNPRDSFKPFGPCSWANNSSSESIFRKGSNSNSSGIGYVCASLLMPLPDQCLNLSKGGCLQVYAVKHAPSNLHSQPTSISSSTSPAAAAAGAPAAAAGGQNLALRCLQEPGCIRADSSTALPAVALLSQQYVSVLQLSSMLARNPAAAMLSASATTEAAAATGTSGPNQPYSCILQLQAAQGHHAAMVQQQQQQQQQVQASSHKRSRAGISDVNCWQQGQQQEQAFSIPNQQQQNKAPLGTMLGDWLKAIAVAQSHGICHHSSSSSTGNSNISVPGQRTQLALLRGQVSYHLGQGAQGQLSWASGPLIPSQQQQQATNAASATAAKVASAYDSASSNVGPRLPVQVAMQATTISGWAQIHRSFVMAGLQQLLNASMGITVQDAVSHGAMNRVDSHRNGRWCIVTQKQQLQNALHQMTQLHQQLMWLQQTAEQAVDVRAQVLSALYVAIGGIGCFNSGQTLEHQQQTKQLSSAQLFQQLRGVLNSWELGLCAGYGRAVLAASSASCLLCFED